MQLELNLNVLLVSGDRKSSLSSATILARINQNVLLVDSVESMMRELQQGDFDLVLLDGLFSGLDHLAIIGLIQKQTSKFGENSIQRPSDYTLRQAMPIILLTDVCPTEAIAICDRTLGIVDYVLKPIEPESLRARIALIMDLFQKTERIQQQARQIEVLHQKLRIQAEFANHYPQVTPATDADDALSGLSEKCDRYERSDRSLTCAVANNETLQLTQFCVDQAIDAIFWIGPDARFQYVNEAACRSLGYSREELLAMTVADIDPDVHLDEWDDRWRSLKQKGSCRIESLHLAKDGRIFPVEIAANYLEFNGQEYNCVFVRDISDRKQTEAALWESEERYRSLYQNTPVMLHSIDASGRLISVSNYWLEHLGYSREEAIGKRSVEFLTAASRHHAETIALPEYFRTGFIKDIPYQWIKKNGEIIDVLLSATAEWDDAGNIVRSLAVLIDVTERNQAEASLRQSEETFRQLADNIREVFYVCLPDGEEIIYISPAYEQIWGRSCASLRQHPASWIDAIHPEDRDAVLEAMPRKAETGNFEQEFRIVRPDGTLRWIRDRSFPVRDASGQLYRTAGIAEDITERKQTEEALRESEARYRAIVEDQTELICRWLPDGVLTFVNDAYCRYFNKQRLALIGHSFLPLIPAEDRSLVEQCIASLSAQKPVATAEHRVILANGEIRWQQWIDRGLLDDRGQIVEFQSVGRDITERKQAELALLEERNFVSAILDTAGALAIVLDWHGRIVRFNRACEQLTGYSFEEVRGSYFGDLFVLSEELESVKAVFQRLQAGQFPQEYENHWLARDGIRHLISWSNTVLLDSDGSVKYVIGIGIDISDRKHTEEIRRALEREKELSQLQLRFFSMISHEFRTPLSTILMSAQILEHGNNKWLTQKSLRNLQRIQAAVKHLLHLLEDMLTINRAETGKLDFTPRPLDLQQFCRQLVEEVQLSHDNQYNVNFVSYQSPTTVQSSSSYRTKEEDQQLTPYNPQMIAMADEKLLRFILSNLLSNAIKYSLPGSSIQFELTCQLSNPVANEDLEEAKELEIQRKRKKNSDPIAPRGIAIFCIQDRGIGIDMADQRQIFEPFHRGENAAHLPGSGLGLTVVKKCVELHGGEIAIQSELEVGTTATVVLPLNPVSF